MNTETKNARSVAVSFPDTPNCREYVAVLHRVQNAICSGDSHLAARICDDTVELAESLTVDEIIWTQGVSSDLDTLCGEEILRQNVYGPEDLPSAFQEAYRAHDADLVLVMMRQRGRLVDAAFAAYVRARAYSWLGFTDLSLEFFRLAARLDPDLVNYKMFVLDELKKRGDIQEAQTVAEATFSHHADAPVAVVQAAATLYLMAAALPDEASRPILGMARLQVERILREDGTKAFTLPPKMREFTLVVLANIQLGLNRVSAAKRAYAEAISINPSDATLYATVGNALLERDPFAAYAYFEQAVRLGTVYTQPYFVLAKEALVREDWPVAADYSSTVLELLARMKEADPSLDTRKPESVGMEFLGIAQAQIFGPIPEVITRLERALELAPEDQRLRDNVNAIREAGMDQLLAQHQDLKRWMERRRWLEDLTSLDAVTHSPAQDKFPSKDLMRDLDDQIMSNSPFRHPGQSAPTLLW